MASQTGIFLFCNLVLISFLSPFWFKYINLLWYCNTDEVLFCCNLTFKNVDNNQKSLRPRHIGKHEPYFGQSVNALVVNYFITRYSPRRTTFETKRRRRSRHEEEGQRCFYFYRARISFPSFDSLRARIFLITSAWSGDNRCSDLGEVLTAVLL